MSLILRNSLFDMDDFFESFYPKTSGLDATNSFFYPRVDIKDKGDHSEIIADLPGVEKSNLSVTLENGVLTIEASTDDEKAEKDDGHIIRKERRSGKFMRSFTFNENIKKSDIRADFKNGVLSLQAPKISPTVEERKKIDIH